jgi:hypothetical protein
MRILFSAKIKYLQSKSAGFGDVQIYQKLFFLRLFQLERYSGQRYLKINFHHIFFHIGNI